MHLGVGRIFKLLKNVWVRCFCSQFLSLLNSTFHTQNWISEDQFSTKSFKNDPSLNAHWGWHCKDKLVTLCSSHESQSDASIAAGRLNQDTLLHAVFTEKEKMSNACFIEHWKTCLVFKLIEFGHIWMNQNCRKLKNLVWTHTRNAKMNVLDVIQGWFSSKEKVIMTILKGKICCFEFLLFFHLKSLSNS